MFVNLWAGQHGRPLTYAAVYDLVGRLRRRTGIDFDPHWCRHTYATGLLRAGTPVEVVSRLLGHASVTTTVEVYGHLSVEDARQTLEQAGWFAHDRQRGAAVRAPARPSVPRRPALLEQLLGAVRPEFRGRGARVRRGGPGVRRRRLPGARAARGPLAARACARAITCAGSARAARTWTVFAATTDHRWRRQRPNAGCRVTGCGYGTARGGMCQLHGQRWDRAGRPDLHGWLADPPTIKTPPPGVVCAVEHCDLWPQAALPLCHAHANTWKVNGRPDDRRVRPPASSRSRSPPRRSSGWTCWARSCVWRSSTCCSAATTSGPPRPSPRWSWRWCGPWPPPARCRCWTGPRTTGGPGSAARRRATPTCAHC